MSNLLLLAVEFFLIGTFSFGGGMATIPFLFNLQEKYNWFSAEELVDMIALSEVTPGPIGVNMATYVGLRTSGFLGAISSVLSLVAPAIIFMLLAYKFILKKKTPIVEKAFYGLKPVVFALFTSGLWSIARVTLFDVNFSINILGIIIFAIAAVVSSIFKKIHPTLIILGGGLLGAIAYFLR